MLTYELGCSNIELQSNRLLNRFREQCMKGMEEKVHENSAEPGKARKQTDVEK